MSSTIKDNERSYAIDLISFINTMVNQYNLQIKKAGGERTVAIEGQKMFPDLLLYGDQEKTIVLQGWEIKLPDTPITDNIFIKDAQRKALALGLNSCFIWNYSAGALYVKDSSGFFQLEKQWNETNHIRTRSDVDKYQKDWEKVITEIIFFLNNYFQIGKLISASVENIISDLAISTIINRNKLPLASYLSEATAKDARIESYIDVWWKDVETDFLSDERDKFSAYAKILILNWINRIIFAHVIKRFHNPATKVESIVSSTTPDEANKTFYEITRECDFFNIFSPLEFSHLLPAQTWNDLISLNSFLTENGLNKISQEFLQTVLENSVSTIKKELTGQFTTPSILAKILTKITILDWTEHSLDPCCGTGTIAKEVLNTKIRKIGVSSATESTWASDKYQFPLQVANISMTNPHTINEPIRIFKSNVFSLNTGDLIKIVNPSNGNLINFEMPLLGSIVSNLPFIPFEKISTVDQSLINQIIDDVKKKTDITLDGRSDMYSFIIFALHKLLLQNGRLGVITSNSWLGTQWGRLFFKALNFFFEVNQIHISGTGRWFQNAQVVTVLLILTKKETTSLPHEDIQITFSKWNKPLQLIEKQPEYIEDIVNSSLLDKELNKEVVSLSTYNNAEIDLLLNFNISMNALFHEIKWLLDVKNKLIPMNEVFDLIRGERRGWDRLFYPAPNHGIEKKFLKKVLKNAREVDKLMAEAKDDAFCCSLTMSELREGSYNGALNWINKFASEVNLVGKPLPEALKRAGLQWYEMTDSSTSDFCTSLNPDERLFYARFTEPTFINQRLIGLRINQYYPHKDLLHALLNSIIGMFFLEASGFGRGLGALDLNKRAIEKSFLLNPNLVNPASRSEILTSFEKILNREILDTRNEINQPDRIDFDSKVLQAYGLSEHYESIKNSLISMQNARLSVRDN